MSSYHEQKTRSNVSTQFLSHFSHLTDPDINSELDELDREEFYRLKKVSNKKQRDQAAADAEIQKQREAEKDGGSDKENGESADVLGEHEDDDVIF
jgi:V-type H+-transporting ATPase subunit D